MTDLLVNDESTSEFIAARAETLSALTAAAMDRTPVSGWTHNFYRYPARFSPRFAATAIECFSQPTDLILDPYMGGGTAVVEGIVSGRTVVGNDLNSLAAFVAKVKVTILSSREMACVKRWAANKAPALGFRYPADDLLPFIDADKTKNMSLVRARFIKKAVAGALCQTRLYFWLQVPGRSKASRVWSPSAAMRNPPPALAAQAKPRSLHSAPARPMAHRGSGRDDKKILRGSTRTANPDFSPVLR